MRIGSISVKQFKATRVEVLERNEAGRPTKRHVHEYTGGFHVVATVMDCGDGMYQEIEHPAVFKSLAEAGAFSEKIGLNRMSWDIGNWRVGNHPCNAWQRKPEDEPMFYCVWNPIPGY